MMRLLRWIAPAMLALALVACGPPRKSVFPPGLSIAELKVMPSGMLHLTVRIQNNSYDEMDFTAINGNLQIAKLVPVRLHARFKREIPALASDVLDIDVLPTTDMTHALDATTAKGSSGSLAYSVQGTATAKAKQEKAPRDFDFSGNDWLSPVPGIANTFR